MSSRSQLLQAAVEHFADHGIGDRSLRSIAASIGTSHRMLIYHFGSRDGLLAEVVAAVEEGQREALTALAAQPGADPREVALRFWATVSAAARRWGPLFYELTAHAMQGQPHAARLREALVEPWLEPLTELLQRAGVDREDARTRARLGLGVARGLLHDALLTGEFAQADAAMAAFADLALAGSAREGRIVAGTVRDWWDEDGWGVLTSEELDGTIFAHFSAISDQAGYRSLRPGQRVAFTWRRPGQDGCDYTADAVYTTAARTPAERAAQSDSSAQSNSSAYRSWLTIEFDPPPPS